MQRPHLGWLDGFILLVYLGLVLSVGWTMKRRIRRSADFLLSGRAISGWVAGLAFLSANLGAQEIIGMGASGAKYGLMACHFYWLGAVPAMVFLAIFMMPFYYGSKARSVPEYLKLRFDRKTHCFNAVVFAAMTLFLSGISLHVVARLLETFLGPRYDVCIAAAAAVVLLYVFLGGLTSAIYNEVLQFSLIILGFAPLAYLAMKNIGGWSSLEAHLAPAAVTRGYEAGAFTELWRHLGGTSENPMGVGWFGMAMGLGFVLSFGYWCTDFQVIQRAMAARSMSAARRAPLIAAVPKMLFPALIILPGMIALALHTSSGGQFLPMSADGKPDYNLTTPAMMLRFLPPGLLGLGLTALAASFMSGMAGTVTAFNTVWTYDLYQSYLAPDKTDLHYLRMGRVATVFGVGASVGTAYLAAQFDNIMDLIQMMCGFVNAPLFATFLLGMFWRRANGHGAFFGLLGGTLAAGLFHGLAITDGAIAGIKGGWLGRVFVFHSEMGQSFWTATVAWSSCFALTVLLSLATRRDKTDEQLAGLVYSLTVRPKPEANEPWFARPAVLGMVILAAVLALNLLFR
jgi:SSS family solute:Na+ symporter